MVFGDGHGVFKIIDMRLKLADYRAWHGMGLSKSYHLICGPSRSIRFSADKRTRRFLGAFRRRGAWTVTEVLVCILSVGCHVSVLSQSREGAATTATGGGGSSKNRAWASGHSITLWLLLCQIGAFVESIAIRVGFVTAEFSLSQLVEAAVAGGSVGGVVHSHVRLRKAARRGGLEILTVATLENIEFGVMDSGVEALIQSAILCSEMFGAIQLESGGKDDKKVGTHKVGARLALNSQWKTKIVFRPGSQLTDGLGFFKLVRRRNSSTSAVWLRLTAPLICPPLNS